MRAATHHELPCNIMSTADVASSSADGAPGMRTTDGGRDVAALEREVEHVLDDCFFTVGQVVGMRMAVDYDAVIWWHAHYRAKFLAAMRAFGNRWLEDRHNVTAVAWMLGERAVRYGGTRGSIDVSSAKQAAADVERYCELHARRKAASLAREDTDAPRLAGYWCTDLSGPTDPPEDPEEIAAPQSAGIVANYIRNRSNG